MTTVLLVTNETEVGAHVTARIHELRETTPDLQLHILVPAAKRVADLAGYEVDGTARAEEQLLSATELFGKIGLSVVGEVGSHDPMKAVRSALSRLKVDLILLATLPLGASRWLNMDLPHRLNRRFGIPVEYVMGKPVNDNDWTAPPQPIEGPVRILLVEDSNEDAQLMRHALSDTEERIDLTVVKNGEQAIDLLRASGQEDIDLVLLDLRMPQIDGHEFLEIVARDFDVDALNVTVVTSSDAQSDRERAHALGAGAYVFKDPNLNVFAETIRSVIGEVANG